MDENELNLRRRCLERLGESSHKGLSETVLIASVQHRYKEELGRLSPTVVRKALKGLEEHGRVTHSAGRWRFLR